MGLVVVRSESKNLCSNLTYEAITRVFKVPPTIYSYGVEMIETTQDSIDRCSNIGYQAIA
jgi:hypothetical protein